MEIRHMTPLFGFHLFYLKELVILYAPFQLTGMVLIIIFLQIAIRLLKLLPSE